MPTLVSTGQITIVDNNDAKPITAFITASQPVNQIYTKDDGVETYTPNYANVATNQILTAKVYIGDTAGPKDVTSTLSGMKWSTDFSAPLGTTSTLTLTSNLPLNQPPVTYYFEATYTDPVTLLISKIVAQIGLTVTQTGTNAVFVQMRGQDVIKQSTTATKNFAYMTADLVRASGVDDTGTTYQWFELPANTPINQTNIPSWATKYGGKTTVQTNQGAVVNVGTGVPLTAGYTDTKTLIIGEPAVNSIGLYRVEVKDTDGKIYQGYFTVHDVSDMYNVSLISTAGDKLQNGQGSTDVYPIVYYGASALPSYTGWTFKWYFYDGLAPGKRAGFVDTSRTAVDKGRRISAHTTGTTPVVTFDGTGIPLVAGDMIKLVSPSGAVGYYEVSASNDANRNQASIRMTGMISSFLTWTSAFTANQYVEGRFFVCTETGATAGTRLTYGGATPTAAKITVTGDEIDVKGTIVCEANRP
jgi:hypothetical protein